MTRLLEQSHVVTFFGQGDCGGRAGRTTANDEHVALARERGWRLRLNVHRPTPEFWAQVIVTAHVGPPRRRLRLLGGRPRNRCYFGSSALWTCLLTVAPTVFAL